MSQANVAKKKSNPCDIFKIIPRGTNTLNEENNSPVE